MMKKQVFWLMLLLPLLFVGCKNKQTSETAKPMTDFERSLNSEDSLTVVRLVDDFFNYVEAGELGLAAGMLYKVDNEVRYAEPELLDNEEMASVREMFETLPVYSHHIDYIKFLYSHYNEVKCSAAISPEVKEDGTPVATTTFYLRPVFYMGSWVICLMSSEDHDQLIVANEDKDSLARQYDEVRSE